MQDNIFKNLRKYYQPTVLFQAHVDLILEPIHELHKLYYDNVLESKQFIYQKGYELAELKVLGKIQEHVSMKSDTSPIFHPEDLSSLLEKDQLFGTSKSAAAKLEKDTFNASQKTLSRVDKDINNLLVDSYQEGVGYKEVGRRLTKKFNQLKTFEAERIARTETHSAHELGTMQAFEDLDVEYLQWDAHLDNRVRETHEEINGEIIPLGGTFSNGLKYPGDKNGPIKEWINCRCHGVPYILPPGTIAPNMPYFRESDLIYVNQPKLEINKTIGNVEEQDNVDQLLDEINKRSEEWDIYRLTPDERSVYLKYKKNYIILDDAIKNKNYSRLDDLEESVTIFTKDKESFMTNTENLKDYYLVEEEMKEYLWDIKDFEKIIKDTNIKIDIKPKNITWNNPDLKQYKILNENKEYVPVNRDEKFIKYYFKDEDLTILESVDMDISRVRAVYKSYKELPSNLKKTKEIVLSSQKPRIVNVWGSDSYVGGYVVSTKGNTRIIQFNKTVNQLKDTLTHESAHLLEKDADWFISNSKEYILAFKKDQNRLLAKGYALEDTYITPYSYEFTEEFVTKKTLAVYKYGDRQFSEDFAESVKMYLRDKNAFAEKYPNKAKVIEKAIKGKYNSKNTISYEKWFEGETGRFRPTFEEMENANEIKWKQTDLAKEGKFLSRTEENELQLFNDKSTLNYLHNKKIKGEILPDNEEKEYLRLYDKFNKRAINKVKKPEGYDKFKLNKQQKNKYKQLTKKAEKEPLGFTDKTKLKNLEKQERFNELNNKKLTAELTSEEKKEYKSLYYKFKDDFNLPEFPSNTPKPKPKAEPKPKPKPKVSKGFTDYSDEFTPENNYPKILQKYEDAQSKIRYTDEEIEDLQAYGGEGYKVINKYLRGQELDYDDFIVGGMDEERLARAIPNIQNAIDKSPGLLDDTILWRGGRSKGIDIKVGGKGKWKEFVSTSFDKDVAEDFAWGYKYEEIDDWVIFKIKAKKGTKGVYMGDNLQYLNGEQEVVLQRNQEFKIISYDEETHVLEVELI